MDKMRNLDMVKLVMVFRLLIQENLNIRELIKISTS